MVKFAFFLLRKIWLLGLGDQLTIFKSGMNNNDYILKSDLNYTIRNVSQVLVQFKSFVRRVFGLSIHSFLELN